MSNDDIDSLCSQLTSLMPTVERAYDVLNEKWSKTLAALNCCPLNVVFSVNVDKDDLRGYLGEDDSNVIKAKLCFGKPGYDPDGKGKRKRLWMEVTVQTIIEEHVTEFVFYEQWTIQTRIDCLTYAPKLLQSAYDHVTDFVDGVHEHVYGCDADNNPL